jgi:hypothetical protein
VTYKISIISQAVLDVVEEDARRMLEPAVARSEGRHSMDSVLASVAIGHSVLWFAFGENGKPAGAVVTQVEHYPMKRMLNLIFCGGDDLEGWHQDMLDVLDGYASDNHCSGLELVGRYGWKRFLEKAGWKSDYVVCQRMFDTQAEEERDAA